MKAGAAMEQPSLCMQPSTTAVVADANFGTCLHERRDRPLVARREVGRGEHLHVRSTPDCPFDIGQDQDEAAPLDETHNDLNVVGRVDLTRERANEVWLAATVDKQV